MGYPNESGHWTFLIFLFLVFFPLLPDLEAAEEHYVTLECSESPLVNVLSEVHRQTLAKFVYDAEVVEGKKVSCKIEHKSLKRALPLILYPCEINFEIYPDQVIVLYQDSTLRNILHGCVVDSITGLGLPYANIIVDGSSIGTASDTTGYFSLDFNKEAVCTLRVQYIGYEPEQVVFDTRNQSDLSISMKEKPILTRNVIVHSTELADLEVRQSQGQIAFDPNRVGYIPTHTPSDILQCLQTMSGTRAINEYLNGLYVNSSTPDQNLVLLDGIPLFYAEHLWGYINLFQSHAIRQVELSKSGFPVRFGDKLSSVIELDAQSCENGSPRLGIGVDFFSMYGYLQTPVYKRLRAAVSVRKAFNRFALPDHYYHTEDYLYMAKRRYMTNLYHGKVFNYFDVLSKLELDYGAQNRLSLTYFTGQDEFNLTKYEESDGQLVGKRIENWGNSGIGLNWENFWCERFKSHLTVAYSTFKNLYNYYLHYHGMIEAVLPDGSLLRQPFDYIINEVDEDRIRQGQVRLVNIFKLNSRIDFSFGAEYAQTQLGQKFPEEQIWSKEFYTPPEELVIRIPETSRSHQQVLFIENRVKAGISDLTVGLRAVKLTGIKNVFLEPRSTVKFDLFKSLALRAHWGRYIQSVHRISPKVGDGIPMRTSFFWSLSDDYFKPAGMDHTALGLDYNMGTVHLEMNLYSKKYRDLLHLLPYHNQEDGQLIAVDRGIGKARGFEVSLMKNYGLLSGWISYHLSSSDYQFPHVNEGLSFLADHDRTHEVNLVNRFTWRQWNLTLFGIYASGCPYTPTDEILITKPIEEGPALFLNHKERNTKRLPAYRRIDLTLMREFEDLFQCDVNCGVTLLNVLNYKNVLDRYYQSMDEQSHSYLKNDMPGLPFTVSLFVNVEFNPGF